MSEQKAHVAEYKKDIVASLIEMIKEYPIVGAVNMENLPTAQLQKIRASIRGKAALGMTKKRLIMLAIEEAKKEKKGIGALEQHLVGMPALIFTKENPFKLYRMLEKSKSAAPAKPGQIAPRDIMVNKGPTSFAPGPIIGELAQVGIKSGVEAGKVAIKEDSIVARKGDKISAKAAEILTRMGITPMEVGLDLVAVYENGTIFAKDVLAIDEKEFNNRLIKAASNAINLSVFICYPTKDTIRLMIGKAFNDAKTIGLSQNIIDEGIVEELMAKAERSMLSLKATANIETVKKEDKPKAEAKPEVKEEKPKAEAKQETPKAREIRKEIKAVKQETKAEEMEEKVLEEEEGIIEEEKKLEKETKKAKIEAPVEKEVENDVKEEEEKQLERERIEKEKEFERIEEEKKKAEESKKAEEEKRKQEQKKAEEAKKAEEPKTDDKVAEMVRKTKEFATGAIPSAEKLVEEAERETKPAKEEKREEIPTAEELYQRKRKKEDDDKAEDEHKKAEEFVRQLQRKGTLRK